MKLRNKKTGGVIEIYLKGNTLQFKRLDKLTKSFDFNKLKDLTEEWEDYEEPKEYWYINQFGSVVQVTYNTRENIYDKSRKSFGNYFETKEEAEKAVEKLKAWKRLKDAGFRFTGWDKHPDFPGDMRITASIDCDGYDKDIDLLFGGIFML